MKATWLMVGERDAALRGTYVGRADRNKPVLYIVRYIKKRRIKFFAFGFRIERWVEEKLIPITAIVIPDSSVLEGLFRQEETAG